MSADLVTSQLHTSGGHHHQGRSGDRQKKLTRSARWSSADSSASSDSITPAPPTTPCWSALWAAYPRLRSRFENETPTSSGATIVSTSQTEDGYTAVKISVGFTDPGGDTLHFTTSNGAHGT